MSAKIHNCFPCLPYFVSALKLFQDLIFRKFCKFQVACVMCALESQVLAALYSCIHTGFSKALVEGSTSYSPWLGLAMGSSCMTQSGEYQRVCRELCDNFQHMLWLGCMLRGSHCEEPTPMLDQQNSETMNGWPRAPWCLFLTTKGDRCLEGAGK